jgi:plasmid maintenance system antidote protein VapI
MKKNDAIYNAMLAEIKKLFETSKITQREVGDVLGIKQSAVSSLLNGKSRLTLDQFLNLSDLVGLRPQQVILNAQNQLSQRVKMTPDQEDTLYKSEAHLMGYCAAVKDIEPQDLKIEGITVAQIQRALDELVAAGFLIKKKSKYVQKNPEIIYIPSNRLRGSRIHQKIIQRSCELFDKMFNNKAFIATKFNLYLLDRFTVSQTKEIEAELWKVYEKIQSIRDANLASGYGENETTKSMPLWNIHLMMMTPTE